MGVHRKAIRGRLKSRPVPSGSLAGCPDDGKDEYGEATPYTPLTTPEKNCSSEREVGGVGVLVNTHLAMNIGFIRVMADSYESLTTRIGRLRLKRCGSVPALTVFVAYAPTSDYDDEEVEPFCGAGEVL
ncbi:unnamed protein product [Heligmosomoides polygyrus]|uniref:Uncharacterized protein n=1 Tax=Heligmosomoides polygyrus TaxID=6339 RepID=A0A183FU88_HELPZ|nr:unnamed protein product [Heligmosomoides polygyrus]